MLRSTTGTSEGMTTITLFVETTRRIHGPARCFRTSSALSRQFVVSFFLRGQAAPSARRHLSQIIRWVLSNQDAMEYQAYTSPVQRSAGWRRALNYAHTTEQGKSWSEEYISRGLALSQQIMTEFGPTWMKTEAEKCGTATIITLGLSRLTSKLVQKIEYFIFITDSTFSGH